MNFHRLSRQNVVLGWYVLISSEEDIREYVRLFQSKMQNETLKDIKDVEDGCHPRTELSSCSVLLSKVTGEASRSVAVDLVTKQTLTISKILKETGSCYVNRLGGVMPCDGVSILAEYHSDVFPFDIKQKIKIVKWEGGRHFYAKFGTLSVTDGEENKWNTFDFACQAAKRWFKGKYGFDYLSDFEGV